MRRIISIILLCTLSVIATAQKTQTPATPNPKPDVVLKTNGDELTGKVLEMGDSTLKFSYLGETLVYTVRKMDVIKITYGSGRIEFFNKEPRYENNQSPNSPAPMPAKFDNGAVMSTADHHNRIAILPFAFVKDGESAADELSFKVQNECYSMLTAHAPTLTILDPRTTNAILIKAGVNKETIKGFTSADLCNLLGTEYVMDGTVMLDKTSQTTSGSSSYQSSSTNNNGKNKDKYTASSSSSSTSYQNYETTISMSIYNDKGASIFNQNRKSFWTDQNAYKKALEYLLKKTPFYQK